MPPSTRYLPWLLLAFYLLASIGARCLSPGNAPAGTLELPNSGLRFQPAPPFSDHPPLRSRSVPDSPAGPGDHRGF